MYCNWKSAPTLVLCAYYFIRLSYAVNPACSCVVYESKGRSNGVFTTPNFPEAIPNKIDCLLFNFIGQPDELVELTFLDFDIHATANNRCLTDYVRAFMDLTSPAVSDADKWNHELCGNLSSGTMVGVRLEQPLQPAPQSTLSHRPPFWASPLYSSSAYAMLELHTSLHSSRHQVAITMSPTSGSTVTLQHQHVGFRGAFSFLPREKFKMVGGSKRWGTHCTYDFFSTNTSRDGRLFSDRFPQDYVAGSVCSYVFIATPGERIRLTFHSIRLEMPADVSCSRGGDYIAVHDGTDVTATRLRLYCGEADEVSVTSSADRLFVEFVSDDRGQAQGFSASFKYLTSTITRAPVIVHPGRKTTTTTAAFSSSQLVNTSPRTVDIAKQPLSTVDADIDKQNTSPCGGEFTSKTTKSGTFSTPRFPAPYGSEMSCRFVFIGQADERVQIKFTAFNLYYVLSDANNPFDCDDVDVVIIDFLHHPEPNSGRYCGSKLPPMIMSPDNRSEIEFISRQSSPGAEGFSAEFKFINDYGIKVGDRDKKKGCTFNIRSSKSTSGVFTSPNYPGLYPRNTECHYIFYGTGQERVYLKFTDYDIDGLAPGCKLTSQSDYIELSNFNVDLTDRKLSRLCGKGSGYEIHSDSTFFRVTFKTNDVFDAFGFSATYNFRPFEDETIPGKMPREAPSSRASTVCVTTALYVTIGLVTTYAVTSSKV